MTRETALMLLQKPAFDVKTIEQEKEFVANKLDIPLDELNSYMLLPIKTYKDYRNQEKIYRLGASAMRTLGLALGGKR